MASSSTPYSPSLFFPSSSSSSSYSVTRAPLCFSCHFTSALGFRCANSNPQLNRKSARIPLQQTSPFRRRICRAAEYKFPDPIPEFADAETEKFRNHLLKKLAKKEDVYGDSVEQVVGICTEIFSTFLHSEYGGPGTLLVIPFIDMADTVNERGLPGGSQAARAAVKWAQDHVDKDWKEWNGDD